MDIFESNSAIIFNTKADIERFERQVYERLASFLLRECNENDWIVWGELDDDSIASVEEGKPYEEYEQINCYVHLTDADTIKRVKRAEYIPAYFSTDIDYGAMLIGNVLTFAEKNNIENAVSVQITYHMAFDTYRNMFRELGISSFGYSDGTVESCAKETIEVLSEYDYNLSPLALRVKRLIKPVFSKCDLEYNDYYVEEKNNE